MIKISNTTYDRLKWFALVFIPAFEVLILTLGKIWGIPYYSEIGSEAAQRVRIIYKSDPDAESIAIDECIADMFDSRKDQKWNTREEKQSSNTDVK